MVGPQSAERVAGFGATPAARAGRVRAHAGRRRTDERGGGSRPRRLRHAGRPGRRHDLGAQRRHLRSPITPAVRTWPTSRILFLGSRSLARGGTYLGVAGSRKHPCRHPGGEDRPRGRARAPPIRWRPAAMVRGGAALAARELPWLAQAAFGRANSARELGREAAIGAAARRHRQGGPRAGAGSLEAHRAGGRRAAGRRGRRGGDRAGRGGPGLGVRRAAGKGSGGRGIGSLPSPRNTARTPLILGISRSSGQKMRDSK